jgi:hypothetical protein
MIYKRYTDFLLAQNIEYPNPLAEISAKSESSNIRINGSADGTDEELI